MLSCKYNKFHVATLLLNYALPHLKKKWRELLTKMHIHELAAHQNWACVILKNYFLSTPCRHLYFLLSRLIWYDDATNGISIWLHYWFDLYMPWSISVSYTHLQNMKMLSFLYLLKPSLNMWFLWFIRHWMHYGFIECRRKNGRTLADSWVISN